MSLLNFLLDKQVIYVVCDTLASYSEDLEPRSFTTKVYILPHLEGLICGTGVGQFVAEKRLAALSAKGDPLEAIDRLVPWESFRADIEAVVLTPDAIRKNSVGRKPVDAIVMFRMLVLQALHNLSDEQVEYQVRDRLSFTRFLRLGIEYRIPDGTTLCLFREKLSKAGLIERLCDRFDQHLDARWYI